MIKINKYNHKVLSEIVTETDFNNETIIIRPWVTLIGCHFTNCTIMIPDYITDIHFGEINECNKYMFNKSCKFSGSFFLLVNTKSLNGLSKC